MFEPRQAVIVGASSGVGRALAAVLADRGCRLVLAARGARDLEAMAADCRLRGAAEAHPLGVDLNNPNLSADAFTMACAERLPAIDAVFITVGMVSDDDDGTPSEELISRLVRVNYLAVIQLAAAFAARMHERNEGRLVLFSSIAAAAPRRRNVAYASAKAGLEVFTRGLQHRYADSPVRIQVIAPGYVDSPMTFGRSLAFPVAAPEDVARKVLRGLNSSYRFRYIPGYWAWILRGLRWLPWAVYRRLSF